jgi:hypothetical protein
MNGGTHPMTNNRNSESHLMNSTSKLDDEKMSEGANEGMREGPDS